MQTLVVCLHAKLLRALPSLANISTSLPVSLPQEGSKKINVAVASTCIAPQCFDDQRYTKV